jgi:hypothetical protein
MTDAPEAAWADEPVGALLPDEQAATTPIPETRREGSSHARDRSSIVFDLE